MPYDKKEIEIKQNALQFAKDRGDKIQEAQANIELGYAYFHVRQEQNAIKCYQNAKKIAQERGDKYQEGQAYLGIGDVYNKICQYQTAIENYQKVQEIAREREDKYQEGEAYLGIGYAYRGVGQYQTAIEYYQKAKEIARERGDKCQEGQAFLGIGYAYHGVGQYQTAIENYQKVQEIARERGDKCQEGQAYLGIGYAYHGVGQYQTAIENYQKVQEIAREREDKYQEGEAYLGIGNAYDGVGQYQTAIEYYQKAKEIARERGDKCQEGQAYLGIGYAYHGVGQYQTAIENYQKVQEIARERGDKCQEGQAYLGIGSAYHGVGQYQTAIEIYEKLQEIARERGDKCQEGEAYLGIGHAYYGVCQYQTAIGNYQKVQEIAREREDKYQEGQAYLWIGDAYHGVGQYQTAIENYQKVQEIARERGDKWQEGEAYRSIGDAYRDLDQHQISNEYFQKASAISVPQCDKQQKTNIFPVLGYDKARKLAGGLGVEDPDNQDTIVTERPRRSNETETEVIPRIAGQRKVLWTKTSIKHRDKFEKLVNVLETEPKKAIEIGTYSVCLNPEYVIGEGSDYTTVYIGLCDDGMEVAVKTLLDRCKHLGSNEKEILNYVKVRKEQHIVNYRFYTVKSENAYLVLDLCEGSLKDYVLSAESSKAMLESKGVAFLRQILLGLKALHCGDPEILHRDLKPSNIFVNVEGELVLADFGISRKLIKGQTTYKSGKKGTPDWIAVESLPTEEDGDCLSLEEEKVRYKKQSDIQVAGMVFFYILTKGKHPYGKSTERTYHLSQGNPVNLNIVCDPLAKDLIEWMLQHDLRERPGVEECLKHPYLMSTDEMFHFVTRVGNEREIKTKDVNSVVVKQLNADPSLPKPSWKPKIDTEVMSYVSGHRVYSDDVADLLRLIRNTAEHWRDKTPPTTVQTKVGTPKEYFLNLFPTLPVVLHRIIRKDPDWKQREQLKQFF